MWRLYLVGAVAAYIVGNKILQKTGLVDTKEDKVADRVESKLSKMDIWKPQFEKEAISEAYRTKKKGIFALSDNGGRQLAHVIYESKGYFYDAEGGAVGAIRQLSSKAHISALSRLFYEQFELDLLNYLRSANFLRNQDWEDINNHIAKLPNYIINPNS